MILKGVKIALNIFASIILCMFVVSISPPLNNNQRGNSLPFSLNNKDIIYDNNSEFDITKTQKDNPGISDALREEILDRAKAMIEVKWTPSCNLIDKKAYYVFMKGKTYQGVPYSMDTYQVRSSSDFLSKMDDSKVLYGNDCSGFVSAAWGISRQTTLSLYNAVKNGTEIDGKSICKISWDDLKPADALLRDNGEGKGHIMLYIGYDKKNSDNLNVYEQDITTSIPFEPIPVARNDVRSKSKLIKDGYIPIRIIGAT